MRKSTARSARSKFNDRITRNESVRRAARAAAPAPVSGFEALEDRRMFSVVAHYYNDGFWGNGNAGRPAAPAPSIDYPNQTISVARAGDVQTTVENVDFDWGDGGGTTPGSPDDAIRDDNHSTLFVGKLTAPETGRYEILGYGDDDTHVFLDGQLVSSDPGGHGQTDPRTQPAIDRGGGAVAVNLDANQSYDLVVLHAEGGGGSGVRLRWVTPNGDTANPVAVPASALTATVTPVTAPTGLSRDASVTAGVKINFTDNSKSELRYDLQRRQGGGAWATVAVGNINDNSITDYSAKYNTSYEYRVVAWNLAGEAVSATTVPVTTGAEPAATAGAQGYYFNDQWWKTRQPGNGAGTDVIVGANFDHTENVGDVVEDWGDGNGTTPGSAEPGVIRLDNHSTVHTGKIRVPEGGTYQFLAFTDDDSYLWVDGKLTSADPGGHGIPGPTAVADIDTRNPITLTAGDYDFVVVHSEGGGGSGVILKWVTPTMVTNGETTPVEIPASAYVSNQPSIPAAPSGLTTTLLQSRIARFTFTDNATSEVRYVVDRATESTPGSGVAGAYSQIALLPINATGFEDATVQPGTRYFYRVRAENFRGSGELTASITTVGDEPAPAAPTQFGAYSFTGGNRLLFTDNANNEANYVVERRRSSDPDTAFAAIPNSPFVVNGPDQTGRITIDDRDPALVAGTTYVYRISAVNADGDASATATATTVAAGLRTTIIDSNSVWATRNFVDDVADAVNPIVRVDPDVNAVFDDATYDSPDARVSPDLFTVTYEGYFTPTVSGPHTFYGESDDGMRVFVDGQLVVDAWVDRGTTETAATITPELTAGRPVEIRVQYYENGGGAVARLRYSAPGVEKQVVPVSQLTPANAANPLRAPINVTTANVVGEGINVTWVDTSASETGFRVERSTTASPDSFTTVGTVPANQSGFIDTNGLEQNVYYNYRVVALGAGGATAASEVSAVPGFALEAVSPGFNHTTFADYDTQFQYFLNFAGTGAPAFVDSDNDPALMPDRLRLTDGGTADNFDGQVASAFYGTPVTINEGFTSTFDFVAGGAGNQSANPADGFAFVIQASTANGNPRRTGAIGDGGGGLAYTGLNNSVALKFDVYNNINQTGLYINGQGISDDPADPRNRTIPAEFDINGGTPLRVTVGYNPATKVLTQTIDDIGNDATAPFSTSYVVDIPNTIGSGSAYVGFTAATGGESVRQEIISFAFDPTAPLATDAVISQVYVRGTPWTPEFGQWLEANSPGSDDVLGYRVDNLAADTTIPWTNVNQIVVRYATAPTGSGVPQPGAITVNGSYGAYQVTAVTPVGTDGTTFALTLDRALGVLPAPGVGTDGDRVQLSVAGGGLGDAAFNLPINSLQGDANRGQQRVNTTDVTLVRARLNRSVAEGTPPAGTQPYNGFVDLTANGVINSQDVTAVRARLNDTLPAAASAAVASGDEGDAITGDLFSSTRIV